MHQSSYEKMRYFREKYLSNMEERNLKIMDFGSMNINGNYQPIFNSKKWEYVGVDMASGPGVDIVIKRVYFWDGIPSNSFDVVISGQTFEHSEYFWLSILEIRRILKYGGLCCIIAPSSGPEHRYPVDCYRFYTDGIKAIAKFAGLNILEAETEWEPKQEYPDKSGEIWKDTILIGQKKEFIPMYQRFKHTIFRFALKWLGDYRERI
ncbi:MAG: methyltransferase domain-containing protein [Ignavibacteriales bacterium]|nr:methyltransferase domain-containing protein [Ignavibacteriales bacterium]